MAMRSTQKNILTEILSLVAVIIVIGLVGYNWDFLRTKLRAQGYAAAKYISENNAAHNTSSSSSYAQNDTEKEEDDEGGYEKSVTIKAGFHGQFIAQAYVNDTALTLMADTGASMVMFTYEDADKLGLTGSLEFDQVAHTANGKGYFAMVTLDRMRIGNVELENVRAGVLERGKLRISLLGMNFINRLKRFEMRGKYLKLVQ